MIRKSKTLFLLVSTCCLLTGQALAQTALFPGAEWQSEHIFGPGMVYAPSAGRWFPAPNLGVGDAPIRINQHMDRMIMEDARGRIVFHRVCKDDVDLEDVPNVDHSRLDTNLTAWEANYYMNGGQTNTILFEQRGGGVFIGTSITHSDNGQIGKGQYTVSPVGGMPTPPSDDPQDEPTPDTPKKLGLQAVANKLAAEMGVAPDYIKEYMLADVTEGGHLMVRIWLDAANRALHSEREIDDPCDPRYGNITPAMNLYNFKMTKIIDDEGKTYYFIKTQVIDVETGIIQRQFTPDDTVDAGSSLQQEVSDSYDGLNFDIRRPAH